MSPLDRARRKAYRRLLPLCFICYVIAYVDRANVAIAKLTMTRDLPGFDNAVIGFGAGIFFLGYFLLEIPGTLIVEAWSARKWISRIMITWGITAALTAAVTTPFQFYLVRFLLGLAEAGFFPGVIVYLTHWFPSRDRARALAYFFVATPLAQVVSPKISNALLRIGTDEMVGGVLIHHPEVLGLEGWQWVYIAWGLPAVVMGVVVLFALTDRPHQARWLTPEEREAVEFFLPSILERWYALKFDTITWLVILPPLLALAGQLFVGWSSDRTKERRLHTAVPMACAALGLLLATQTRGHLPLTVACFMVGFAGFKAYLPAFLVDAQPLSQRSGRRGEHRPHQLGGEPGRLPGPLRARHRGGLDGILRGRSVLPGGVHDRLRVDRPEARARVRPHAASPAR